MSVIFEIKDENLKDVRIDVFLSERLDATRSAVQKMIENGQVTVNGAAQTFKVVVE